MNDKQWLERILLAYKVYPYPSKDIESFVNWLYTQYGIVKPEKKDGNS
jgi:hypothetical protein